MANGTTASRRGKSCNTYFETGPKLSKSDLLLSMITSSWDGVNARDEIFNFVDYINNSLTRRNDFNKDFIMKSCLVLTDLPVTYKVQNFSNVNLMTIRNKWTAIKQAVESGVDLANSFGIDQDTLSSANAIIPIIYYLFQNPGLTLRGSTPFDVRNAQTIRRFLIMSLLNRIFGGASDNMLREIRTNIQSMGGAGHDFPITAINTTIKNLGRIVESDIDVLEDTLDRTYGERQTFIALSLLYDDCTWGTMQFHQDHIFARNLFRQKDLELQNRQDWLNLKERMGNLCLLLAHENIGKQDMPPNEWLATRDPGFLKRHLIPEDRTLWTFDRFHDFLVERENLIRQRLKTLFGSSTYSSRAQE